MQDGGRLCKLRKTVRRRLVRDATDHQIREVKNTPTWRLKIFTVHSRRIDTPRYYVEHATAEPRRLNRQQCLADLDLSKTFCLMSRRVSNEMSRSRYSDSCSVTFSRSFWLFCKHWIQRLCGFHITRFNSTPVSCSAYVFIVGGVCKFFLMIIMNSEFRLQVNNTTNNKTTMQSPSWVSSTTQPRVWKVAIPAFV